MGGSAERWYGLDRSKRPVARAGIILGVGLGGFFDGIVFHQLLQWHHMLSAHPDPGVAGDLRLNVLADGLFHAATYGFTVLGIALLWRARRDIDAVSGGTLLGSAVLGWGVFNLVEGVVNHLLLGIHHVWPAGPGPVVLWDVAFLVWGALFVAAGYALMRSSEPSPSAAGAGSDA